MQILFYCHLHVHLHPYPLFPTWVEKKQVIKKKGKQYMSVTNCTKNKRKGWNTPGSKTIITSLYCVLPNSNGNTFFCDGVGFLLCCLLILSFLALLLLEASWWRLFLCCRIRSTARAKTWYHHHQLSGLDCTIMHYASCTVERSALSHCVFAMGYMRLQQNVMC